MITNILVCFLIDPFQVNERLHALNLREDLTKVAFQSYLERLKSNNDPILNTILQSSNPYEETISTSIDLNGFFVDDGTFNYDDYSL